MSKSSAMYRTHQVWIKPGHRLYPYFEQVCQAAKNMYNTTNFYIRQVWTAFRNNGPLQPLQKQVLDTIRTHLDAMNERQRGKASPFQLPSPENPFIHYRFLDALFKVMNQADYRALPTQSSQWVIKSVFQNWASFFAVLKDIRQHPEKYKGRPRIPGYRRSALKEVIFTNQDCVVKDHRYLKFPKTKTSLPIGKLSKIDGRLKQVRVIPKYGQYVVEIILVCPVNKIKTEKANRMAIDLGVDNLATIVTTTGAKPRVVKGKVVKAINQYYNKMKAHYTAILRHGKRPDEGVHTSRRLEGWHRKRYRKIKDVFHKASHHIVKLAVEQQIGTIVVGYNDGWKQSPAMGRLTNQSFCHIPHRMLVSMLEYKAAEQGIMVILTEESYTSKSSFLDQDPLPRQDEGGSTMGTRIFSGKRIHRGLYQSKQGIIHADVNGAANIMRKVFPNVTAQETNGVEGLDGTQSVNVSTPRVLSILKSAG